MLQDMKANKWQFLSILLMAFLGVYIFTGVGGEWAGVNHYRKGYYQETNLANGWVWGEGFSDSDVRKVEAIPGVTGAEKRCYLEVKGQDSHDPTVYLYGLKENTICMPKVVEGSPVDLSAKDKVWVDARFAEARNLKVGDSYTFYLRMCPLLCKWRDWCTAANTSITPMKTTFGRIITTLALPTVPIPPCPCRTTLCTILRAAKIRV